MKNCCHCKRDKQLTDFNKCSRLGVQAQCRECSKAAYRRNKLRHAENVKRRKQKYLRENQTEILSYLRLNPCVDCGETDPIVLQFDHTRDKTKAVSELVGDGNSWTRIREEIEKCEVRCANCHVRRTAKQFGWYKFHASVSPLASNQMKG